LLDDFLCTAITYVIISAFTWASSIISVISTAKYSTANQSLPLPYPSQSTLNHANQVTAYQGTVQQMSGNQETFKVCFKTGTISICNRCRKSFYSDEVVIQHSEFCHYINPHTGLPASRHGNASSRTCIQLKWRPAFVITVPEAIGEKLTFPQKQQLFQEFALVL